MTITEAADKTDNKYTILLLSSSKPLVELLEKILESLQAKEEFENVTLERSDDTSRLGGAQRGPFKRAALIICDQDKLNALSGMLSAKRVALPLLVVVESCTAEALDAVYSSGYLQTRGVILANRLRDPEDQGEVVRMIKQELRRGLAYQHAPIPPKRLGWRIKTNPKDYSTDKRLLSLFLDRPMRTFMERLMFVVHSIVAEKLPVEP